MSDFPSNYILDKLNDNVYKGTATGLGTSRYLALYTTNPTAANTGTEATGGSYARQAVTFNASSSGTSTNSNTLTFPNMAAGTYAYFGILDASTAGNLITYGVLASPINANSGDTVTFAANSLSFNLTGN